MANSIQTAPQAMPYLDYPYSVGSTSVPRTTGTDDHLRDLILQVLFTTPGERVNLPEFGVGVQQLLFAPNSDMLRTSTQFLITTSLQRWLGDRLDVSQVTVSADPGAEETVLIEIAYTPKYTQQQQLLQVRV
jgi:uncharacterized protein